VSDAAVEVDSVTKRFRLYSERNQSLKATALRGRRSRYEEFTALDRVSFEVPVGSTFGIIGSNGSGKSTLLRCIARILVPNDGIIRTRGTVASLLELGSGFHPELTGRENVYLNASIMRIPRRDIDARFNAIVDFAGIGEFIDEPVRTYSSGMYVRLGFSVATHLDPDILLVDEVIAVGDADFQDKCLEKFAEFRRRGRTVIVASHALGLVEALCDEVGRLDHGQLVETREIARGAVGYGQAVPAPSDVQGNTPPTVITGLDVLDRHGFAVTEARTGDSVTLRLRYSTDIPIERPVLALELCTPAGVRAFSQHSRDAELMPDRLVGTGSVDLDIPRLALQAGLYEARAAVLDDTLRTVYDARSFGFCLCVSNDSLTERLGLTVLGGRWGNPVHDEDRVQREEDTGSGSGARA
jgi:ABC-2 type transport system ATP-binding protein